ncbi:MAG: porphobilinogen synthase [Saprospiraceae bacterium]
MQYFLPRRPRRNRKSQVIRDLVQETSLSPANLVYPMFLFDGSNRKEEIHSLPGTYRQTFDNLIGDIEESMKLGINSFMIFPAIAEELKDQTGTHSYHPDNFYLKAAREIKRQFPDLHLISDVALDPYSSDGHDGVLRDGVIINDETLEILAKMALAQAEAGFDTIGPSDMMDGRVAVIREALDEANFEQTAIMAYTAKYASAFYGPFRDALDSAPKSGNKKTYQMNPANKREALVEAELDFNEGADYLMVKPALHYLDVIHMLRSEFEIPIAAYHVSGECAMLSAACRNGWLDFEQAMPETLLSIRRAGADVIMTYFAKDFAKWYNKTK